MKNQKTKVYVGMDVHKDTEASGAGYVLERMIQSWGRECEVVAPSLIPQRPGQQRKHDRKDADELQRPIHQVAGELPKLSQT